MPSRRQFLVAVGAASWGLMSCERTSPAPMFQRGDVLPSVELWTLDAQRYSSILERGPFLFNFWATWCLPCRAEMAALDRLHRSFSPRGLKVLGISVDTDVFLVREYIHTQALSFPVLLDSGGALAKERFRVPAYPASYLVDRGGVIAESWLGKLDWDSGDIRQRIELLL